MRADLIIKKARGVRYGIEKGTIKNSYMKGIYRQEITIKYKDKKYIVHFYKRKKKSHWRFDHLVEL